jgi:hypothetical protein
MPRCPGEIIEDTTIFDQSPHLTGEESITWILDDADGFKQYLNDTGGVNLDDLVTGSFYVSRLGTSFHLVYARFHKYHTSVVMWYRYPPPMRERSCTGSGPNTIPGVCGPRRTIK